MECLENIIGITRTGCLCVIDGLTQEQRDEFAVSKSGLYLDELEGAISLNDIKTLDACGEYFKLAVDSVAAAKIEFQKDIEIALSNQYENKPKYNGDLGNASYASFLAKTRPYQYMKVVPRNAGDAVMQMQRLRVIVSEPDTINFYLLAGYENEAPQVLYTTTVETLPNIFTAIPLPENKNLPTTVNGRVMNYYFVWQGATDTKPRDNKLSCGCSGGNAYEDFVFLKGGQSNDLTMKNPQTDEYSHGFNLQVTISCETGSLGCREYDAKNSIAVATAAAIRYKAHAILNQKILDSQTINRFTLMSRDAMYGKRNHFNLEYKNAVDWLAMGVNVRQSGCWICRDNKIFVGNIFS